MPSLQKISVDVIIKYEFDVRQWSTAGGGDLNRDSWPQEVKSQIALDWMAHKKVSFTQRHEWLKHTVIGDLAFLDFLRDVYILPKTSRSLDKSPLEIFEELVGKPLLVETNRPETLNVQILSLLGAYENIINKGHTITPEFELPMIRLARDHLKVNGDKDLSARFLIKVFDGKEIPIIFMEYLMDIKNYNDTCAEWYKFVLTDFPVNSHHQNNSKRNDSKNSFEKKRKNNNYDSNYQNKLTKTSTPIPSNNGSVDKRLCYTCGSTHGGDCRYANATWSNHENVPWSESKVGIAYRAKQWFKCPPTLEAGLNPPIKGFKGNESKGTKK